MFHYVKHTLCDATVRERSLQCHASPFSPVEHVREAQDSLTHAFPVFRSQRELVKGTISGEQDAFFNSEVNLKI